MSESVVSVGDRFHVITRRMFADDVRRHFAGEVTKVAGDLCEMRGYAFVFDVGPNEYRKRPEVRTRVFSFASAGLIVNKLPPETDLASLQYRVIDHRLLVTDMAGFTLDINEFGSLR